MERGSLFCVLNNEVEDLELDWIKRVNVVKSVVHALMLYMHYDCTPPIVHRDISSSNILLDYKLDAFLSDFGTARLLHPDSSNQTLLADTYGYIAAGKYTPLFPNLFPNFTLPIYLLNFLLFFVLISLVYLRFDIFNTFIPLII